MRRVYGIAAVVIGLLAYAFLGWAPERHYNDFFGRAVSWGTAVNASYYRQYPNGEGERAHSHGLAEGVFARGPFYEIHPGGGIAECWMQILSLRNHYRCRPVGDLPEKFQHILREGRQKLARSANPA